MSLLTKIKFYYDGKYVDSEFSRILMYYFAILSVYELYCSFNRIYNYKSPCFVHTQGPWTHK